MKRCISASKDIGAYYVCEMLVSVEIHPDPT